MVRKTRRPALRQPRHRNHRPPHPPRRKTGDYGIGVVSKVPSSFLVVCRRVVVHWRAIILLLVLSLATFLIAQADFFDLLVFALFLICIASQFFWIGRILDLGERFIPGKPRRAWLAIMAGPVYFFFFLYSYPPRGLGHIIPAAPHPPPSMPFFPALLWGVVGGPSGLLFVSAFWV